MKLRSPLHVDPLIPRGGKRKRNLPVYEIWLECARAENGLKFLLFACAVI